MCIGERAGTAVLLGVEPDSGRGGRGGFWSAGGEVVRRLSSSPPQPLREQVDELADTTPTQIAQCGVLGHLDDPDPTLTWCRRLQARSGAAGHLVLLPNPRGRLLCLDRRERAATACYSVLPLGQFGSIDAGGSHEAQDHVVLHIRIRGRENGTPGATGFAETNVHADARLRVTHRPDL